MPDPTAVNVILAMLGGVALKWFAEKFFDVIFKLSHKADEPRHLETKLIRQNQHDVFERHVIEVLAKMTVLLEEITRKLERKE